MPVENTCSIVRQALARRIFPRNAEDILARPSFLRQPGLKQGRSASELHVSSKPADARWSSSQLAKSIMYTEKLIKADMYP